MFLCYFDENKYSEEDPHFHIGGFLIPEDNVSTCENIISQIQYNFFGTKVLTKETEMHGKDIFHGKGPFKGRTLKDRLHLLADITNFVVTNKLPVRVVTIDVQAHRKRYAFPEPEYRLGLMLILERFCDCLDKANQLGLVFGDYERDEITRSILDFSQFKSSGKTPMYYGRPLGRLIDTIYFTHSHHSRFLQVADIIVFMANRCHDLPESPDKYPDRELKKLWDSLVASGNFSMQKWP